MKSIPTCLSSHLALKTLGLLILLFTGNQQQQANNIYFNHIGINEGLSQINILSIYQDEIGALWFGSLEGLNRFNGKTMEVFHPSQSDVELTQNEIHSICGNQKGALYLRAGHDLIRYDITLQQFACLRQGDINALCYHNDTLWVATDHAIFYYLEKEKELKLFTEISRKHGIPASIHVSDSSYIWVGTPEQTLRISRQKDVEQVSQLPAGEEAKCFYRDKKNNLWIGTDKNGLYRLGSTGETEHFVHSSATNSISNNQIRDLVEDELGNLWVGTFLGLNTYNPISKEWKSYTKIDNISYSLSHSSVFALCKDMQGTIWIGTYFGGINYFNPKADIYQFYGASQSNQSYLSFPFVGKMTEDTDSNLWICTEGGGLNRMNLVTRQFTRFMHQEGNAQTISHNNLKCIWHRPEKGWLYIGTHTGGLSIFDKKRQTFRTLRHHASLPHSLPNDIVNEMQYYKENLVILTQAGITSMDLDTEQFSSLTTNEEMNKALSRKTFYETFLIDSQERLWLARSAGGLTCIDLVSNRIKHYASNAENLGSIGKFKVIHIFEDSKGQVFFGTLGSGLFRYQPQSDNFECYTSQKNQLLSDYCYFIAESPYQHLVVLHKNGVSFFSSETGRLKHTYGFPQIGFNQGSSVYFTRVGETFFGGIDGLASLHEQQLYAVSKEYRLYFDKLLIDNEEIRPGDATGILSSTLAYCKEIELDYNQKNLILEFASSNYIPSNDYRYEYYLEGFDRSWNPVTTRRIAYTNLSPGSYRLIVRDIGEGSSTEHQVTMDIHIRSPFYATTLAYLFYFLLIIGLLYAILRFKIHQAKLKASLEYERKEKGRIEELNQTKLRFFTNISHEFRTPLTLIIGQIESLLQLNKLTPSVYNRMLRIYKNANHMRDLISELLDFRKQEQGYLTLKVKYLDIISFTKEIYMSFYEYALKRRITYKIEHVDEKIEVWFDPTQLQKVVFNLLSNAFKYTKAEDSITLNIHQSKTEVSIRIIDSGIGIPQESIHRIFDRFYQIDNLTSELTLGTGIGLALSKGIIELHKGTISVESSIGKGSTFTIKLLQGGGHFSQETMQASDTVDSTDFHLISNEGYLTSLSLQAQDEEKEEDDRPIKQRPTILLVEDSPEILDMLEEIFSPIYQVYTATNGKEGLDMTHNIQPDIVLSDVMMPEMSGKEMCYKIKNSIELSHIPVVLLTAQTSVEYAIEGYMFGADDYITKPFNVKVLISRCNNLVKSRRLLFEKFSHQQEVVVSSDAINEQDQLLIDKTTKIIKSNFENQAFDMNMLATELGLGRSKLYIKLKNITGLTPNEFTLKLRLDEGMRLLNNNPNLNISEISYRLGFSSARYFSKCFKSFYGVAPLTCRKAKEEKKE